MDDNCSHTSEVVTAGYRSPELEDQDAKYNQAIEYVVYWCLCTQS